MKRRVAVVTFCSRCGLPEHACTNIDACEIRCLRAELAALKTSHAAELRAVAERQREAARAALVANKEQAEAEEGMTNEEWLAWEKAEEVAGAVPLVTEEK